MANKEGKPSTSCSTNTTNITTTTDDSKLAVSTEKLEIKDNNDNEEEAKTKEDKKGKHDRESEVADLDSVLSGGCSICGSEDHDDIDCDEEDDDLYMMSTALHPSTSNSASLMSTVKGGRHGRSRRGCSK
ncbi:hypothetical protein VM1G_04433 [Cytospora mali]|uniref:Uncharacterized protein n=1 Tax=Cytospora mali TaxID=578113 RepID=A0A194VVL8_CYTMA|nr:hypothetical protein VM1G_04433 [Valsa mali]